MYLKTRHFYIWVISIVIIFILLIAGFTQYLSSIHKASAISDKSKSKSAAALSDKYSGPLKCGGKAVFSCTVKYLHYLHYLPISHAGKYGYEFSFPVPEVLQKVADSYTWNSRNPFILGAITQYLEASGRLRDGEYANPQINAKLLSELKKSAANGEFDPYPWKWVLVRQAIKGEMVELYENGREVFSSPANTGEFATTPDGTWYVFLRFRKTAMSGLSPSRISLKVYESLKSKDPRMVGCLDGHPVKWVAYKDSGIKYVDYFDGGIALHYISRPRYGFPQSAGCVELPYSNAKFLHKNIGYGTIVTVSGVAGQAAAKRRNGANAQDACSQPSPKVKPVKPLPQIEIKANALNEHI
ncbi:MAG: L,D-transpeptidase [Deltaproteobacteria bacterium]|jgi:hypothetical protein|nr:L,D-transpeptidase [Deltaproteobacteria bacterium]MCL5879598.1 L,D-transpeptidase [Deltaproteobacteria bacterium]